MKFNDPRYRLSAMNRDDLPGGGQAAELGDEQRVKVLSPGMLVVKRFVRNRLAITGFIIILFMFLFSFLGGLITPYGETEDFKYVGIRSKEYASVTQNTEFRYTVADGMDYSSGAHSKFILAQESGKSTFSYENVEYTLVEEGEDFYRITQFMEVADVTYFRGVFGVTPLTEDPIPAALSAAVQQALEQDQEHFTLEGIDYTLIRSGRNYTLGQQQSVAIESKLIVDPASSAYDIDYAFKYAVEKAASDGESSFTLDGQSFDLESSDGVISIFREVDGVRTEYAVASDLATRAVSPDIFLSVEFKTAIQLAITQGKASFVFPNENGEDVEYTIERLNNVYTIKTDTPTHLISTHEKPSWKHWLGTDKDGMDVLTRLMYGGQISLRIGFIVVLLETVLGVILGGISGYFGKWVDMLIMRLVDVFNCIPFLPLMIILGAVMDKMDVPANIRIYYLMLILGLMSWPGIARMVRGQILSLREQEFMIAAEATGLSTYKRIFKHLIPNVIPQLIVFATLGLGSVILYESTLSFLGLGVKFPYASWGNIISGVSTAYEMTNFWFVWIPAGMLILLTVLGFNFVGDGLRDAFDPKMKR